MQLALLKLCLKWCLMVDDGIFSVFFHREEEKTEPNISESSYSSNLEKPIVLSIGGSLIVSENLKPDIAYIGKLSALIEKLKLNGKKLVLVVGGGRIARAYIAAAKSIGANNYALDEIGILCSRLNAKLLIHSIKEAYPEVLTEVNMAAKVLDMNKIPVFGGLYPGITTDAVSALIAESLQARFFNLTNVDGIYSSDPNENPRAKFYESLSYDRLLTLMSMAKSKPGQNIIIDLPACLILKRSNIEAIFLNGFDLDNLEHAINGLQFKGTIIKETEENNP